MKQERLQHEPAWSHPLAVADLPPEGAALKLVPGGKERAALAHYVGVLAVPALVADVKATPDGNGGVVIEGDLVATVRQTCVVSLEPFDNAVNEHIALRFLPPASADSAVEADESEGDLPDVIVDGTVDLGMLVAEFLALGVDPYPRRSDAVFAPPAAAIALERHPDSQIVLVGDESAILPLLDRHPELKAATTVVHADVAVRMDDKPSQALRQGRRRSSMWLMLDAVRHGQADVAISAGNTGALMAMAKFCLKTM